MNAAPETIVETAVYGSTVPIKVENKPKSGNF